MFTWMAFRKKSPCRPWILSKSGLPPFGMLYKQLELLKFKEQIHQKVREKLTSNKEYYLSNQLKTIQDELGLSQIWKRLRNCRKKEQKKWGKEIAEIFEKEVQKLERANPNQPDYAIQLNYLQLMIDLPGVNTPKTTWI